VSKIYITSCAECNIVPESRSVAAPGTELLYSMFEQLPAVKLLSLGELSSALFDD
jgi:hypothetical protein